MSRSRQSEVDSRIIVNGRDSEKREDPTPTPFTFEEVKGFVYPGKIKFPK